jgi:hypothetical protein
MDDKKDAHTGEAVLVREGSSLSVDNVESQGFDEKATKKLIRKLDWHLIPFLSLIYLYVNHPSHTELLLILKDYVFSIAPILEMPGWTIWRRISTSMAYNSMIA